MSRKTHVGVPVVDTEEQAARMRETFHDSKARKRVELPFGWPKKLVHVGFGEGVIYWSDKWKTTDTYKHRREIPETMDRDGRWDVFITDALQGCDCPKGQRLQVVGKMPKHIAYIGKYIGFQFIGLNDKKSHIEIDKSDEPHWAAAKIPSTGETILFVYAKDGVQLIVAGDTLGIEKDGIVG